MNATVVGKIELPKSNTRRFTRDVKVKSNSEAPAPLSRLAAKVLHKEMTSRAEQLHMRFECYTSRGLGSCIKVKKVRAL